MNETRVLKDFPTDATYTDDTQEIEDFCNDYGLDSTQVTAVVIDPDYDSQYAIWISESSRPWMVTACFERITMDDAPLRRAEKKNDELQNRLSTLELALHNFMGIEQLLSELTEIEITNHSDINALNHASFRDENFTLPASLLCDITSGVESVLEDINDYQKDFDIKLADIV